MNTLQDCQGEQSQSPLNNAVREAAQKYFKHFGKEEQGKKEERVGELDQLKPLNVYDMVLGEVEKPLLEVVMKHTKGNQSNAAKALGLSRGTLRKKLKIYGMLLKKGY